MSPEISERAFEEAIERVLLQGGPDLPAEASAQASALAGEATAVRETSPPYGESPPGGYRKRKSEDYDRTLCLLPRDVVDFVLATALISAAVTGKIDVRKDEGGRMKDEGGRMKDEGGRMKAEG